MIKGKIFLGLFALPFLGVGVWMLWSITTTLLEWQDMRGWERVPAQLVRGGYSTHSGDESTTFKAYAEYNYSFNGFSYTGHRAAITEGADNVGDFQQDLGNELSGKQGRQVEVFVNPETPEESIYNREMRWAMVGFKMIFVVAFGGFGLAAWIGILRAPNREKELNRPEYKDAPWLANDDWQGPAIGSNSKAGVYFAWFFTVIWNAVSAPMPFMVYGEVLKKENYPALIGLLFPVIGIGLLVWSVRKTLEWRRFGNAPVTLDPFPGGIGGHVGGHIDLPLPHDPDTRFLVTLTSLRSYEVRDSDGRSQREEIKWQKTLSAYTESGIHGTRVVFRFDVPAGLQPSNAEKPSPEYYLWRLNVRAEIAGTDVDRDYEIPVYATAQKSRHIPERVAEQLEKSTQDLQQKEARAKILLRPGTLGEDMVYPMGRNISSAITLALVGAAFLGSGYFMTFRAGIHVIGEIFLFVGVLLFPCGLYMPLNSLTVSRGTSGEVVSVRRILGIPVKRGSVMPADIHAIEAVSNFGTTTNGIHVKHYTVYGELGGKKRIVLGEGFHGQGEADAAIAMIRDRLGLNR